MELITFFPQTPDITWSVNPRYELHSQVWPTTTSSRKMKKTPFALVWSLTDTGPRSAASSRAAFPLPLPLPSAIPPSLLSSMPYLYLTYYSSIANKSLVMSRTFVYANLSNRIIRQLRYMPSPSSALPLLLPTPSLSYHSPLPSANPPSLLSSMPYLYLTYYSSTANKSQSLCR